MTSFSTTPGLRAFGLARSIAQRPATCKGPDGIDQFCVPAFTVPDNVTNNEVGWKTEWWDHRLQFNGAVYQEVWSNAQTGFFDPQGGLGNLAFATNGPELPRQGGRALDYRTRNARPDHSSFGRLEQRFTDELAFSDRQLRATGVT